MPKGIQGFRKGEGGRKKGSLNKATLSKLERRAVFEEEVSQMWKKTIKKMRPEYIGDQFMGTATQKIEHSGEIRVGTPIPEEAIEIIEEDLKRKKTENDSPSV